MNEEISGVIDQLPQIASGLVATRDAASSLERVTSALERMLPIILITVLLIFGGIALLVMR